MLIARKRNQTRIIQHHVSETCVVLDTEQGKILCQPIRANIIRIVYTLEDDFPKTHGPGFVNNQADCQWTCSEEDGSIFLKTSNLTLAVNKETGSFTYFDATGKLLTKEPDARGKTLIPFDSHKVLLDENSTVERIETPDGVKEIVQDAKKVFDQVLYHARLEFEWEPGEALYGLGQQEDGVLNLRGTRQYVYQANMKIAIPVILSTNRYGIVMDTGAPLILNDTASGSYLYCEACHALDYTFIFGETFDEIVSGYRTLTGKAAMLPKWAFGYMLSQERFETQQEILDTVMAYRNRQVPLDSIVLDWQSWENGMWGQKTFDRQRFPDAKAMTDALHENGAHFMISIWPNMVKDSDNHTEMKQQDCLFQHSEIYNAFDEKARQLYWKQAQEGLFSQGVDAWWCDSSEPFTPEWNSVNKPEPDRSYLDFHETARIYMDETLTNAYPLYHAQGIYEGQRSTTSQKRVVNLTRSAYTGQQKYGVILWSGDISASWKTLKNQIAAGLNFCASGLPYWTLDIGAFFVKQGEKWFWDGQYEEGNRDLAYRELYTRWFQLGAFLPVFRTHGTDTRREIWHFGEPGELFYDALLRFTELRYRLMPYIYSVAGMVTLRDDTLMRLLAFDFMHDPHVYDIKDQYLFGPALMICPVTEPMYDARHSLPLEKAEKTRPVYLPTGCLWYDFWTHESYAGGQEITAQASLDIMPIFVKAGSIIPVAEVAQHAAASSNREITLRIYPGADGHFTLYQDEQDNYNYEQGAYSTIELSWDNDQGILSLGERLGHFTGMEETIVFTIDVVGRKSKQTVYQGGKVSVPC